MDLHSHFRETRNKLIVNIRTLEQIRDREDTDKPTRRKLDNKIAHKRQQLSTIDEIWNVQ